MAGRVGGLSKEGLTVPEERIVYRIKNDVDGAKSHPAGNTRREEASHLATVGRDLSGVSLFWELPGSLDWGLCENSGEL